ncbi:Nucleosome-remodeling factor subunit NURF301 [Gryllus bimaculatus]|nr:Nucleosome-remodeling factor subunit NURF301 [Gryllus bimaculatus]
MEEQKKEEERQTAEKTEPEAQESELGKKTTEDESSCDTGPKNDPNILEGCAKETTGSEKSHQDQDMLPSKLDDRKDEGVQPETTAESQNPVVGGSNTLVALPVIVADKVSSREQSGASKDQQNRLPRAVQLHSPTFVTKQLIFVKKIIPNKQSSLPPKLQAVEQQSLPSPSNLEDSSSGVKRKRDKSVSNGALESSDVTPTIPQEPLNKRRRNLKTDGTYQNRADTEDNSFQVEQDMIERKYVRLPRFKELEDTLIKWTIHAQKSNVPINGVILRKKALNVAKKLGITDFTASNGWIDRFKKKHNIVYRAARGVRVLSEGETKKLNGKMGVEPNQPGGQQLIENAKQVSNFKILDLDRFCWICHRDGIVICCATCPRVYHMRCVQLENSPSEEWVCPECMTILNAENVETRSRAMRQLSLDQLCNLLKYALHRMKAYPGTEPFCKPVDQTMFPRYREFVAHPMDLSQLERNIRRRMYGSTEAFIADTKWILHDCIIFNTHHTKLSSTAKAILKICKQEMSEIEICPDCYLNAHTRKDSWFIEVCRKPHVLLWAKLKGFPFWPAKVMRTNRENMVDVRFFGAHDRAWVPVRDCFLYSKCIPTIARNKKKHNLEACVNEVEQHIRKLRERFGRFEYAPFRTPFDPSHEEEHLATFLPGYAGEKTVSQMPFQHRFRPRILRKPSDKPPTTDPQTRLGGFRVTSVSSEAPSKIGADAAAAASADEADDEGAGGGGGDGYDGCDSEPSEPVAVRPASAPPTSPPSSTPTRPLRVYSRRRPSPSAPNVTHPIQTEPINAEEQLESSNDISIIKQEPEEIETSKIGSALLSDWARFEMEAARITMNQHQSNTSDADLEESAAIEVMDIVEIKDELGMPELPGSHPTDPLSPSSHVSNTSPKPPMCNDSVASPSSTPVVTPAEGCSDSLPAGKQSLSSSPASPSLPPPSNVHLSSSDTKNDDASTVEKADRPAPSGESDLESLNITEDDTSSLSSASETAEREIWARMTEEEEEDEEEETKEDTERPAEESEGIPQTTTDPGKLATENDSNSNISRKRSRESGDSDDSSAPSNTPKIQKLSPQETSTPTLVEVPQHQHSGSGDKLEDASDKKAGMLPDLIRRLHGAQPRMYKTHTSRLKIGTDETSDSEDKYDGFQEGEESDSGLTAADYGAVNSPVGGDSNSNSNSSLSSSSSSNSGASSSSSSSNSSCSSSNSNNSSSSSSTSSNVSSNSQSSDPKPPDLVLVQSETLEVKEEVESDKWTAGEIKITDVSTDNEKDDVKPVSTNAENKTEEKIVSVDGKNNEEKGNLDETTKTEMNKNIENVDSVSCPKIKNEKVENEMEGKVTTEDYEKETKNTEGGEEAEIEKSIEKELKEEKPEKEEKILDMEIAKSEGVLEKEDEEQLIEDLKKHSHQDTGLEAKDKSEKQEEDNVGKGIQDVENDRKEVQIKQSKDVIEQDKTINVPKEEIKNEIDRMSEEENGKEDEKKMQEENTKEVEDKQNLEKMNLDTDKCKEVENLVANENQKIENESSHQKVHAEIEKELAETENQTGVKKESLKGEMKICHNEDLKEHKVNKKVDQKSNDENKKEVKESQKELLKLAEKEPNKENQKQSKSKNQKENEKESQRERDQEDKQEKDKIVQKMSTKESQKIITKASPKVNSKTSQKDPEIGCKKESSKIDQNILKKEKEKIGKETENISQEDSLESIAKENATELETKCGKGKQQSEREITTDELKNVQSQNGKQGKRIDKNDVNINNGKVEVEKDKNDKVVKEKEQKIEIEKEKCEQEFKQKGKAEKEGDSKDKNLGDKGRQMPKENQLDSTKHKEKKDVELKLKEKDKKKGKESHDICIKRNKEVSRKSAPRKLLPAMRAPSRSPECDTFSNCGTDFLENIKQEPMDIEEEEISTTDEEDQTMTIVTNDTSSMGREKQEKRDGSRTNLPLQEPTTNDDDRDGDSPASLNDKDNVLPSYLYPSVTITVDNDKRVETSGPIVPPGSGGSTRGTGTQGDGTINIEEVKASVGLPSAISLSVIAASSGGTNSNSNNKEANSSGSTVVTGAGEPTSVVATSSSDSPDCRAVSVPTIVTTPCGLTVTAHNGLQISTQPAPPQPPPVIPTQGEITPVAPSARGRARKSFPNRPHPQVKITQSLSNGKGPAGRRGSLDTRRGSLSSLTGDVTAPSNESGNPATGNTSLNGDVSMMFLSPVATRNPGLPNGPAAPLMNGDHSGPVRPGAPPVAAVHQAVTQAGGRLLPQLQPRPLGQPGGNSLGAKCNGSVPAEAGPISQEICNHAQKMAGYMQQAIEEMLRDMCNAGNVEASTKMLQLELEKVHWRYQQEIAELKHNTDLLLVEMRASMMSEQQRAVADAVRQCEMEKQRAIEETKKKQWCTNCGKEALFYCCWNTSYCDYPCQHMASCGQAESMKAREAAENGLPQAAGPAAALMHHAPQSKGYGAGSQPWPDPVPNSNPWSSPSSSGVGGGGGEGEEEDILDSRSPSPPDTEQDPNNNASERLQQGPEQRLSGPLPSGASTSTGGGHSAEGASRKSMVKRKRCGRCAGCSRSNCGRCPPCLNSRTHQVCRERRCSDLQPVEVVPGPSSKKSQMSIPTGAAPSSKAIAPTGVQTHRPRGPTPPYGLMPMPRPPMQVGTRLCVRNSSAASKGHLLSSYAMYQGEQQRAALVLQQQQHQQRAQLLASQFPPRGPPLPPPHGPLGVQGVGPRHRAPVQFALRPPHYFI